MGPQWDGAAHLPAADLTRDMQAMLTHSGFTTVEDKAPNPGKYTTALRRRVEGGEVAGPTIYTAGFGLYPPHGIPFYLADLPASLRAMLPQPATPGAAILAVQHNQAYRTDIVKLFTGSYLTPNNITHMPLAIARKPAVAEGHRHHQLVFAHPSDLEGVRIAIDSGVDVLAHAPDTISAIDNTLVQQLIDHHMAMIPTLKLFSGSGHIAGDPEDCGAISCGWFSSALIARSDGKVIACGRGMPKTRKCVRVPSGALLPGLSRAELDELFSVTDGFAASRVKRRPERHAKSHYPWYMRHG